jgi:hypothetical protein
VSPITAELKEGDIGKYGERRIQEGKKKDRTEGEEGGQNKKGGRQDRKDGMNE